MKEIKDGWRDRLVEEVRKATRPKDSVKGDTRPSMLEASRKADLGRNFVQQFTGSDAQDIRLGKLLALCDVLDISLVHVLTGVKWDPEIQEALAAFSALKQHDPGAWEDFRKLLGRFQGKVSDEVDSNMEAASQRVRRSDRASE